MQPRSEQSAFSCQNKFSRMAGMSFKKLIDLAKASDDDDDYEFTCHSVSMTRL